MTAGNQPRPMDGMRRRRRPSPSALVSLALHVVLGVFIWNAVQLPAVFDRFLQVDRASRPVAERIDFVTVSPPVAGPVTSAAPRRVAQQARTPAEPAAPVAIPLVAPTEVPTQMPPPSTGGDLPVRAGAPTGPLRGGSGSTRGVQPTFDDPRVWASNAEFIYAPKTDQERLDSSLIATLRRHVDSLAVNAYSPNKFERGDWTVERNGQKYGIDRQFIRLGPVSIPTALLALLPLNRMPGSSDMVRDRNVAWMRADLMMHAQAAMNEEQFRKAVRAIRDRKERERRASERTPPNNPGPLASPGEKPPPD